MKVLALLGLVLALTAITVDAITKGTPCTRQSRSSSIRYCRPYNRNGLAIAPIGLSFCCEPNEDAYPLLESVTVEGERKTVCSCVPSDTLCQEASFRCPGGVAQKRFFLA